MSKYDYDLITLGAGSGGVRASRLAGKYGATNDDDRREIWRWILFDNHKFTASLATLRYLVQFAKTGETPVTEFLRARIISALKIVDHHLDDKPFITGERLTIADLSMVGYLYYGEIGRAHV